MNIAESINRECIAACDGALCRELHGDGSGRYTPGDPYEPNIYKLHKHGIMNVINYWNNKDTIGGDLLWNYGYYHGLSEDTIKLFDDLPNIMNKALEAYFNRGDNEN